MPGLFLPRRWTRQPQGAFTPPKELFGHQVIGAWTPDTLIDGHLASGVSPWGRYVENVGNPAPHPSYVLGDFPQLIEADGYTVVSITGPRRDWASLYAEFGMEMILGLHVHVASDFSSGVFFLMGRSGEGELDVVFGSALAEPISVTIENARFNSEPQIAVIRVTNALASVLLLHGGTEYSASDSYGSFFGSSYFGLGRSETFAPSLEPLYGYALLQGQLTDSEARAILHDPWMIARPRRPLIYNLPPPPTLQYARPSSDLVVGAWQGVSA